MNEIQTTGSSSSNGLVPQYEVINEEWNKRMEETLNEEEQKLLQELRQRLKDDYCEEVKATATLIRFLRARKWDLDKSEQMYRHRNEWVKSYKPQLITHDMCLREFASGQAYWAGHDKHGRPTLMLRASKNDPSSYTQDDLFKCIIYMMEVGYRRLPNPPYNQYIVMYDLQGVSKKNLDFNSLKKFSSLGDYYPELLGCVYLLRPHWMLNLLFGVIRAIMDPVTQSKVRIIKEENLGQLLEDYDVEQLEKDLGGDPKYEVYPLYDQIRAQLSQQQNQ